MTLKLFCRKCFNEFEIIVTNEQLETISNTCLECGNTLEVLNLRELIAEDFKIQCKERIEQLFKEHGIEYTVELIIRNKNLPYINYFYDVLREKGLIK